MSQGRCAQGGRYSPPSTCCCAARGRGTFVATHHEARVRYRFLRLAADDEAQAGSGAPKAASWNAGACARRPGARGLGCAPASWSSRRLLCMTRPHRGGRHLAARREFRGLTLELLTANKAPMYGLFESEFGVSMVRADEKLRAVAAPAEIAPCLMFPRRRCCMSEPSVYTYGDRPMEIRRGLY